MLYNGRVFMSIGGRGGRDQFSNTFEFQTDHPLISAEMATWGTKLGQMLAGVLLNVVAINRVVISTIAAETAAQGGDVFRSITLNLEGLNAVPEESRGLYDINHCLVIARSATLGRAGAILVRGALLESDVQAGANGEAVLSAEGKTRTDGFNANMGNALTYEGFQLGMVRKLGTGVPGGDPAAEVFQFNPIGSYTVNGVRLVKRNHKFFNRKPGNTVLEPVV